MAFGDPPPPQSKTPTSGVGIMQLSDSGSRKNKIKKEWAVKYIRNGVVTSYKTIAGFS
jgi:hypothetical protein